MRGIIFSAMGVAVLTTIAMVMVLTLEHTKNTIPINKTLLGGRIQAAHYHILWEYKESQKHPENADVRRGCAPFITLDTRNDPISMLARPYITYVCGE